MRASFAWEGMAEISSHPSSPCSVSLILSNSKKEGWVKVFKSVFLTIYSHFVMDSPPYPIEVASFASLAFIILVFRKGARKF
jgi:hypothetical protein